MVKDDEDDDVFAASDVKPASFTSVLERLESLSMNYLCTAMIMQSCSRRSNESFADEVQVMQIKMR